MPRGHTRGELPVPRDAEHSGNAIRFKVVVTEDEVEGDLDYKMVASLKLPSVVRTPVADLLIPAVPVDSYARLVDEGRRDDSCLVSLLEADVKRLDNQLRLVLEQISDVIQLGDHSEMALVATLRERGYDQDPLIEWAKERRAFLRRHQPERQPSGGNETVEEANLGDTVLFNYLLDMPLWSLTREGMIALTKERKKKADQLSALRQMSFMNSDAEGLGNIFSDMPEGSDGQSDDGQTTGYSMETSSGSTEGMPSTPGSSTARSVGERRRYRRGATRGGEGSRVVNEHAPDDTDRAAPAPRDNRRAVGRNMQGERVHVSSVRNPRRRSSADSNADDHQQSPTASHRNDLLPSASRQDHQKPSTSTAPQTPAAAREGSSVRCRGRKTTRNASAAKRMHTASGRDGGEAVTTSTSPARTAPNFADAMEFDSESEFSSGEENDLSWSCCSSSVKRPLTK